MCPFDGSVRACRRECFEALFAFENSREVQLVDPDGGDAGALEDRRHAALGMNLLGGEGQGVHKAMQVGSTQVGKYRQRLDPAGKAEGRQLAKHLQAAGHRLVVEQEAFLADRQAEMARILQ